MRWLDWFKSEDEPRQGPLVALLEALALVGLSVACFIWGLQLSGFALRGWGAAQRDAQDGLRDAAAAQDVFTWTALAGLAVAAIGVFGAVIGVIWSVAVARRWAGRSTREVN